MNIINLDAPKYTIYGASIFDNNYKSLLFSYIKGHGLAGARHFSLGHQKSHGNFKVKKI